MICVHKPCSLFHNAQDNKVKDRFYENEKEYQALKLKQCCRLTRLHLLNYVIPTCEWNYKDEHQHHQKGDFIDLVFKRPILQDERDGLMPEHDGINSYRILLLMRALARYIGPETASRCRQYNSLFIMNKMFIINKEKISKIT